MSYNTIRIEKTTQTKEKPNSTTVAFRTVFTDNMFILEYTTEKGWHDGRIVPYGPIELDPASTSLHYGQTVFAGLKAYVTEHDEVQLFRPDQNMARINRSSERLQIHEIDEEYARKAHKEKVQLDKEWVPKEKGTSLYIRPFIIVTEATLGGTHEKNNKFIHK